MVCQKFIPTLDQLSARRLFNLPEHVPLLINVGRLSASKNQSLLINVVEKLATVHLAVVGEGELREELLTQWSPLRT